MIATDAARGTPCGHRSAPAPRPLVELPSGLGIHDIKLMVGPAGRRWLAMPSQKQLDHDGDTLL